MNLTTGRRFTILFALILLFIVAVSIGADLRLLPLHLIAFPYYDKLGHVILYGLLGLLLHLALGARALPIGRYCIPFAFLIVAAFAVVDELQQSFMPARSFDLTDLAADLLGVLIFIGISGIFRARRIDGSQEPITIKHRKE